MEESDRMPRKLAAVLYADVAGYSRLTGEDEDATHHRLSEYLDLISRTVKRHHGHVMHYAGDAVLAMFDAVVDTLSCAAQVQQELDIRNKDLPDDRQVRFRIGVNLGDIIEDRRDIYGDGVNVAARLESLAEPGGICISESVHTAVAGKLPLEYEYIGEQQVKNISKPVRVYRVRLIAGTDLPEPTPVHRSALKRVVVSSTAFVIALSVGALAYWQPWRAHEEPASLEQMALPQPEEPRLALPDKPSIAVLPFTNMSNDSEQEYFADGLTEDLITDLSRISGLFVIARNSSFAYKGQSPDVRDVASNLGVKFVLEGSVRRQNNQVRINAQLIDATVGGHVWAERYDSRLDDVFELQDEITSKILSALEVQLTGVERHAKARRYTKQLDAYDSLLKGLATGGHRSKETNLEARANFEEAIALDPAFARAYGTLANTHRIEYRNGWSATPEQSMAKAYELGSKAIELDDSLPQVHFVMALIHREAQEHTKAVTSAQRAIELDPNYADARVALASVLCYGGRADEGVELMRRAIRLNPHHPSNYPFHLGQCYFALARYEKAIDAFEGGVEMAPDVQRLHVWLAASYVRAGRPEDAEWEVDNVLTLNPDFSVEGLRRAVPFKDPNVQEAFLAALRTAGLPD